MSILDAVSNYRKAKKEADEAADMLKKAYVEYYCEKEEMHIGKECTVCGIPEGQISRITAGVDGHITLFWKKYKKDGTLSNRERYYGETSKYMYF